ncbi:MAG: carboxypeptidase-like regulatory domain-containing protein [bacterium]
MADLITDLLSLQYSDDFSISGTQEEVVNLTLTVAQDVDTTLYGIVTDNEVPIEGATVKVFDSNGNPYMHTVTGEDGSYSFEGLPVETYTIAVSYEGYRQTTKKTVSLFSGATIETNFSITADETLTLGAIYGITYVMESQVKTTIGGIKMSLFDSEGELMAATYSVDDGEFAFYDIADGTYSLIATGQGYLSSDEITINITNGSFVNTSITMTVDSKTFNGTVNGTITNNLSKAVEGCFVGLYEFIKNEETGQITETLVAVTKTNAQGEYLFGGLSQGDYVVKAKQNA